MMDNAYKSIDTVPADQSAAAENVTGRLIVWVLVRVTGLLLALLVLAHFAHTHIINDVADTDSEFVTQYFDSLLFILWDWLMLVLAVVHGAAGIWVAITEYGGSHRRWRYRILVLVSGVMLVVGTMTLVSAWRA